MYQLPGKPRDPDILRLLAEQVSETVILDYKRDPYGNADQDKREMLRDIASFANANGGHIVLGVREEDSLPQEIVGVQSATLECERILASVRSNTDPRLLGVDVHAVEVPGKGTVVVVFIPRSPDGPHMVTFGGLNQFWKRVGTSKQTMNALELREHFMRGELLRTRMVDFLDRQWELATKHIVNTRGMYFSLTPTLLEEDRVRAFDPPLQEAIYDVFGKPGTTESLRFGALHPTLNGIENQRDTNNGLFQLFRSGHMDYTFPLQHKLHILRMKVTTDRGLEEGTVLHHGIWARTPLHILRLARTIFDRSMLVSPIIVQYGLIFANGMRLPIAPQDPRAPYDHFDERGVRRFDGPEQHVRIQMQFDHGWEPEGIAKALVDRFWNAFHWPECPFPLQQKA